MASTLADPNIQKFLKWMAILSAIMVVCFSTYHYISGGSEEIGELHYRIGNLRLEDGDYQAALTEFNSLLKEDIASPPGLLGRALALKLNCEYLENEEEGCSRTAHVFCTR